MADAASSSAGVVMADPSVPSETGECFWWTLPRELRDVVLKMAYGGQRSFTVQTKSSWDLDQRGAKRQAILLEKDFVTAQFVSYMSRFLVSQQWLIEAKTAFLSSTHMNFSRGTNPISSYSSVRFCFREVRSITADMYSILNNSSQVAASLPRLKRIHLVIRHLDFETIIQDKRELHLALDILTEQEVCAGPWYKDFHRIHGLVEVTFSNHTRDMPRASEACTKRMQSGIELMKDVLTKSLTRPAPSILVAEPKVFRPWVRTIPDSCSDLSFYKEKPRGLQVKHKKWVSAVITDDDVPESESEARSLVRRDPEGVAKYLVTVKKRLQSSLI